MSSTPTTFPKTFLKLDRDKLLVTLAALRNHHRERRDVELQRFHSDMAAKHDFAAVLLDDLYVCLKEASE
jgi:hypothetical protein